ncbi:hypothetical protein ACFYS7_04330 [Streptomyces avermitilis]|uniref:hypothetical protein n=1 Tax=Streptomyces avermitilis TaxID=33903 RepID=UPI0036A72C12
MNASPTVRTVRAAAFAVGCVLLAVGGHALATGAVPPVWLDVAGALPVFAAAFALGGRERSLAGIGGAMLTVQGGMHLAFDAVRPRAERMHMPGTAHGMQMAHQPHAMTSHAVAAHLAAALLASWCLRRGEAALWSLLRKAVAFVPGLAAWWRTAPLPAYTAAARPYAPGPHRPRRTLLRHALSRRGPPAAGPYPA